ncbi:MAG TPA: transcriptional regulator [Candidatus Korarchaeota archaeon]|nr:transcriptional regulator [Candidatus Korarchaeota archaeon]
MDGDSKYCVCKLIGAIDVIGRKWSLVIVGLLGNKESYRFSEIQKELKVISPKTLTDTLKKLEKLGVIKRKVFNEIPPRVEYSLTESGKELRKIVLELLEWSTRLEELKDEPCVIMRRKSS